MSIVSSLERWFPVPGLLFPRAAGIDLSDTSVKWIELKRAGEHLEVDSHGSLSLPSGLIEGGLIRDMTGLSSMLRTIRTEHGIMHAHAALPEEAVFVFSMEVPAGSTPEQMRAMIEFDLEARVPIAPSSAVYDFDIITECDEGNRMEIGVTVFPKDLAESYLRVFQDAGIEVLSLELEARSIARAVSCSTCGVELVVDYGSRRTGLAVIKNGIPIFTNTALVGGETITQAIQEKLGISADEVEEIKNTEGLTSTTRESVVEIASAGVLVLGDEIVRAQRFWDTRKDSRGGSVAPLSRVVLVGGSANLKGVAEYVAGRVQVGTERGNVWRSVCTFDEYIPSIDRRTSLRYATAVGLALRSF